MPWDAFVRAYPAAPDGAQKVALYYADRTGVRRRGLHPGAATLPAHGFDAAFLARIIQEYVHRPEHRAAIGTVAELDRLTAAVTADRPHVTVSRREAM